VRGYVVERRRAMITELLLSVTLVAATDLPIQCLREKNMGQCVGCCKESELTAKQCISFCKFVKPPPPSNEKPGL
jgi:hypothetical protein